MPSPLLLLVAMALLAGAPQLNAQPGQPPSEAQVPIHATPVAIRSVLLYGANGTEPAPLASFLHQQGNLDTLRTERARPRDPWLSFDKVQHFTFSFLFTVGGQYTYVNKMGMSEGSALPLSIGTAWTIGLLKEFYDWRLGPRRYFSERDLIANSAGVLVAAMYIVVF